ncbi:hypothetical protein [Oceanobacter mangrovi]|uniref:hypothetical protein n=1 Tax=Oceanobacter mangrovi TaxID=2862510 RepID=UPI001C8D2506|nr:hypothetical protein [Oceanobacter mangrovi]
MKIPTLLVVSSLLLTGCALTATKPALPPQALVADANGCVGSTELPAMLAGKLTPASNDDLLQQALGEPGKGGLCKAAVYQVTEAFTLYRAWNSTYSGSRLGSWWAYQQPAGLVAGYRENYEICYQWSPIDKLVRCTIKAGTQVVIGPGQSATCSEYFSYGVSPYQQVFLTTAADAMVDCDDFDGVMSWQ